MEFLLLGNRAVPMSESRSCCSGGAPILPHLAAPARLQWRQPQHIKQSRIPDCSMFGPDWTSVREGGGGGMMDGCGGASEPVAPGQLGTQVKAFSKGPLEASLRESVVH